MENFEKSCGAVVFCETEEGRKYLMVRSLTGVWGFPKGHMEQGESEIETAAREIREETGLTVRFLPGFRERNEYDLPGKVPAVRKEVVYFLAECEGQDYHAQEGEITAVSLMDFSSAYRSVPFEPSKRILRNAEHFLTQR